MIITFFIYIIKIGCDSMNLNNNIVNELFDLTKDKVENISKKYNYSNDITHLLHIIVPAFCVKYGFENINTILKVFYDVPIILKFKEEKVFQAFYTSFPYKIDSKIITKKCIVIYYYKGKEIMELIDNIVHEYNHAMNSYFNEVKEDYKYIYLRTGLMYSKYSKDNILESEKDKSYILEEIINTKQTEELIDIINSFNRYNIRSEKIKVTLYNVEKYINNQYSSNAYILQSTLCKDLMNNKTLISVLSNNRFLGNIDEIEYFFDNIMGSDGKYRELINILNESVKLEEEYAKTVIFKNRKIKRIKNLYERANELVNEFNRNYHFK